MNNFEISIRFKNTDLAEAGVKIGKLQEELLQVAQDVRLNIKKEDESTQDSGTILVMVLGTPAIIAIANGISSFIARYGGTIQIDRDGRVIGRHLRGDDLAKIIKALQGDIDESSKTK